MEINFTTKPFFEFFCPVKIIAGHGALEHLPYEVASKKCKRVMIITDKGVRANNLLDPLLLAFEDSAVEIVTIFDDVPPDSSLQTVRIAANVYRDNHCDAIIAVGGGSVIDTSKAVNILVTEGGDDLIQYSGSQNLPNRLKPLFMIPTTAGTGAEVTMAAVISDTEREIKMPFSSHFLMPDAAIIDARMTMTLPPHITAMTAMDAMTHAIEAYTSLQANPISDAYATGAIKMIAENLPKVIENPKDEDARLKVAEGSTMAGIAFSNSMVGMVHSIGHATGAVSHLPHGLCMSMYLPYVLEYNLDTSADRIGELLLFVAGAEAYASTPKADRAVATIKAIRDIRDMLYAKTKLPRTLTETGKVSKEDFKRIAERAIDDGSILYNPKPADLKDVLALLEKAWV